MNICIPVNEDKGLESEVCAHFGSAPAFMIVDTESGDRRTIPNHNQHHGHGMCMPVQMLQGEQVDGLVVGGIGMGALNKLGALNIRVYVAAHATVGETVAAFQAGALQLMLPGMACAGHGHSHS